MHAIYVLEGDEQRGPFSAEDIRRAVAEGDLTLAHLGWVEGAEGWEPLADILASGVAEEEESTVVAEGRGYVVTDRALRIGDEVFPLGAVASANVEVEHTRRGRAVAGSVFFGVLVVIALALPHRPETTNQWVIWAISLVVFLGLFLRFLISAFKPSATFVAIHLKDGDDRILPMPHREARRARKAIEEALEAHVEPAAEPGAA